jgi:4-amino-4-deoxy-L-arabinose transferase-like glycosyltransferase
MTSPSSSPGRRAALDCVCVAALAIGARLAVVAWAASRIPPTADGAFYHVIATRMAQGLGYTWLWPDGVVTYAAHYPVGYPALVGALYALVGPRPVAAMVLNALVGAAAAVAVHALARRATSPGRALMVGCFAALHVGLVLYTAALMTEGVTAALCVIGAFAATKARESGGRRLRAWLVGVGLIMGIATLVRPQSFVLAPVFGWLAMQPDRALGVRLRGALWAVAMSAVVCAPWVVRNEIRMGHAALSFNGGWNLLIGATPEAAGTWAPVRVPESCRLVFDEADKDLCFGREATLAIVARPWQWFALSARKLSSTFDYCGGAGWYLHEANPLAFSQRAKIGLGVIETVYERLLLAVALLSVGHMSGERRRARWVLAIAAAACLLSPWAWVSYLALLGALGLLGRGLARGPVLLGAAAWTLAATAVTHAIFFGSGRYSMVVFPMVTALASGLLTGGDLPVHTAALQGDSADAPD